MLSKTQLSSLRNKLFRHLDGIVIAPTAYSLKKHGVTDYLIEHKSADLRSLAKEFHANEGYLNVALRGLCSQGWLEQEVKNDSGEVVFKTNGRSKVAFDLFYLYEDVDALLKVSEKYHPRKFEMEPFLQLESIFTKYQNNYGIDMDSDPEIKTIQEQVLAHIEGIILGPTIVHLGMTDMFHRYYMETRFRPEEFHQKFEGFERLLDILRKLNWFTSVDHSFEFTETGLFFAKRASAYGVTVSYIPTLRKLDDLIFGNPLVLENTEKLSEERHVDRAMNVWGSGGAHTAYFKVVDEIIIELFNKPIEEQPKGLLDMGCGNGAFLQHLFSVIYNQTYRGTILDQYPLQIIGVDYNKAALEVSRENLIKADVWAKIIWGDIGDPDLLAADLQSKYGIDLKQLLNVRTFLDHNRIWEQPNSLSSPRTSKSTGAYAYKGKWLANNLVSESLRSHFNKWEPYVEKYGLLLIELHTVKPELIAANMGKTAATAYDLTHGYSDQYIIEIDEFMQIMAEVGLVADMGKHRRYPNSELATVSINLFKAE
jgi:SAM-dependent methyltransferase